jgi:hypothetical protein
LQQDANLETVENVELECPPATDDLETTESSLGTSSETNSSVIAASDTKSKKSRAIKRTKKYIVKEEYIDIIKDAFWESKPWILA